MIIHGDVLLESEVPRQCFIQVFNEHPNQEHLVDYFECKACVRNGQPLRWICKSCASVCHKSTLNRFSIHYFYPFSRSWCYSTDIQ